MLLSLLVIIPFFSSFIAFFSYKINKIMPRWVAFTGILLTLLVTVKLFLKEQDYVIQEICCSNWSSQLVIPWIPRFGISFNIAIDGFSIIMLFFSSFLSMIALFCSWNEIKKNEGFFYFNFMLIFTGTIGIFISVDLFLFFFFWEIISVPMYFLIYLWSSQPKTKEVYRIANKFFIYGQISGLILLSSILMLVLTNYHNTNILTFNYDILLNTSMNPYTECIIMLGFFVAFSIKMPILPFHGWLTGVHTQSSYYSSIEIIGVLLKTAPYSILRYNLSLFPHATLKMSSIIIFLGLLSMFYGAWMAFFQNNIKKLIAYSSLSHMGLILIGIYSRNEIALEGVIIQILSNSLSATGLCILSGQIYKNLHTYDITRMRGLWSFFFWVPAFSLFFCLANLGVPGTGNFVGEFLILSGIFQVYPLVSIFATIYIVFSSIYSLNVIQRIFYGVGKENHITFFINKKELWILLVLILALIILGLKPQKIIDISYQSIDNIQKHFNYSNLKIRL